MNSQHPVRGLGLIMTQAAGRLLEAHRAESPYDAVYDPVYGAQSSYANETAASGTGRSSVCAAEKLPQPNTVHAKELPEVQGSTQDWLQGIDTNSHAGDANQEGQGDHSAHSDSGGSSDHSSSSSESTTSIILMQEQREGGEAMIVAKSRNASALVATMAGEFFGGLFVPYDETHLVPHAREEMGPRLLKAVHEMGKLRVEKRSLQRNIGQIDKQLNQLGQEAALLAQQTLAAARGGPAEGMGGRGEASLGIGGAKRPHAGLEEAEGGNDTRNKVARTDEDVDG